MSNDRLPYWPATLNQKMAAAYCGVSVELFKEVCPVKPIAFTASSWGNRYLRQRLDEWLLSLDPNSDTSEFGSALPSPSVVIEETGSDEPRKGPGGYSIIDDAKHPLREWYDRLGFDPRTMGQEEMTRLQKEAHDKWAAWIPSQPLGKREKTALSQLAAFGPDVTIELRQIKNCGPDTEDRLKARGYLETKASNKFPDRIAFYILTPAGFDAWQAQSEK
ncbi:hypothetical protein [Ensifer canadensis]